MIHLCGKGKLDASLSGLSGYVQYEYINEELKDLFALADLVISRAGANSICELLALHKPIRFSMLVPSRNRALVWFWKKRRSPMSFCSRQSADSTQSAFPSPRP